MLSTDRDRLERAYHTARAAPLAGRTPDGHWVGELSTSALSAVGGRGRHSGTSSGVTSSWGGRLRTRAESVPA